VDQAELMRVMDREGEVPPVDVADLKAAWKLTREVASSCNQSLLGSRSRHCYAIMWLLVPAPWVVRGRLSAGSLPLEVQLLLNDPLRKSPRPEPEKWATRVAVHKGQKKRGPNSKASFSLDFLKARCERRGHDAMHVESSPLLLRRSKHIRRLICRARPAGGPLGTSQSTALGVATASRAVPHMLGLRVNQAPTSLTTSADWQSLTCSIKVGGAPPSLREATSLSPLLATIRSLRMNSERPYGRKLV
jgi:hypothetical protein